MTTRAHLNQNRINRSSVQTNHVILLKYDQFIATMAPAMASQFDSVAKELTCSCLQPSLCFDQANYSDYHFWILKLTINNDIAANAISHSYGHSFLPFKTFIKYVRSCTNFPHWYDNIKSTPYTNKKGNYFSLKNIFYLILIVSFFENICTKKNHFEKWFLLDAFVILI